MKRGEVRCECWCMICLTIEPFLQTKTNWLTDDLPELTLKLKAEAETEADVEAETNRDRSRGRGRGRGSATTQHSSVQMK